MTAPHTQTVPARDLRQGDVLIDGNLEVARVDPLTRRERRWWGKVRLIEEVKVTVLWRTALEGFTAAVELSTAMDLRDPAVPAWEKTLPSSEAVEIRRRA